MSKNLSFTVRVWRQDGPDKPGRLENYPIKDITPDMSFLEMLDVLNDQLVQQDGLYARLARLQFTDGAIEEAA